MKKSPNNYVQIVELERSQIVYFSGNTKNFGKILAFVIYLAINPGSRSREELSQDTQFIIITHNRNTVQAADVIYGVTMGRDSASQVISLKLDEVTDEFIGRT